MPIPTPDFIKNDELNEHEKQLLACAREGRECFLYDKAKAEERVKTLRKARARLKRWHETKRRRKQKGGREHSECPPLPSDESLELRAIRKQAEAPGAPRVRAALIRFLALGGNDDYPVDPGGIHLRGARVTGCLDLERCQKVCPLRLVACVVEKAPVLRHCSIHTLDVSGTRLPSIVGDGINVMASVFIRHGAILTEGNLSLLGARISGDLDLSGARINITGSSNISLAADRINVGGDLFLYNKFCADGNILMRGATINGEMHCEHGMFEGLLNMEAAVVKRTFHWRKVEVSAGTKINLSGARVGALDDDSQSWPRGEVSLDGFRYERIVGAIEFETRRNWLYTQKDDHLKENFRPQPFEQLARVLRDMGHSEDARRVAMLKERYQRDASWLRGDSTWGLPGAVLRYVFSVLFERVVGFGYTPFRALLWLIGFWITGAAIFSSADRYGAMVPNNAVLLKAEWKAAVAESPAAPHAAFHAKVPDYQRFNALVYSLDTFVPLVDLHQETEWIPQPEGRSRATFTRFYLWVHIVAGWVITALFAASLTGLVKRDV